MACVVVDEFGSPKRKERRYNDHDSPSSSKDSDQGEKRADSVEKDKVRFILGPKKRAFLPQKIQKTSPKKCLIPTGASPKASNEPIMSMTERIDHLILEKSHLEMKQNELLEQIGRQNTEIETLIKRNTELLCMKKLSELSKNEAVSKIEELETENKALIAATDCMTRSLKTLQKQLKYSEETYTNVAIQTEPENCSKCSEFKQKLLDSAKSEVAMFLSLKSEVEDWKKLAIDLAQDNEQEVKTVKSQKEKIILLNSQLISQEDKFNTLSNLENSQLSQDSGELQQLRMSAEKCLHFKVCAELNLSKLREFLDAKTTECKDLVSKNLDLATNLNIAKLKLTEAEKLLEFERNHIDLQRQELEKTSRIIIESSAELELVKMVNAELEAKISALDTVALGTPAGYSLEPNSTAVELSSQTSDINLYKTGTHKEYIDMISCLTVQISHIYNNNSVLKTQLAENEQEVARLEKLLSEQGNQIVELNSVKAQLYDNVAKIHSLTEQNFTLTNQCSEHCRQISNLKILLEHAEDKLDSKAFEINRLKLALQQKDLTCLQADSEALFQNKVPDENQVSEKMSNPEHPGSCNPVQKSLVHRLARVLITRNPKIAKQEVAE